jgi:hypothetical protein
MSAILTRFLVQCCEQQNSLGTQQQSRTKQEPQQQPSTLTMALPVTENQIIAAMDLHDAAIDLEGAKMHFEDAAMAYADAQMEYDNAARELARVGGGARTAEVEERGVSPAELYMEDLRAADEERASAYRGQWTANMTNRFATVGQAINNLAAAANYLPSHALQPAPPPPRPMDAIAADIHNVQRNINDALAALREMERGNGNVNEEARALAASINGRLQMERGFFSHLQLEFGARVSWLQGPYPPLF